MFAVTTSVLVLGAFICVDLGQEQAEIKIVTKETSLGKVHRDIGVETLVVSPDNKHVAYVAGRGDKQFVVTDRREGKEYDGIHVNGIMFSPDGSRMA